MPPMSIPDKQVSSIAPFAPVSFADWGKRGRGTRTLSPLYPGRRTLSACLPWAGMFRAFSASAASRPGKRARLTQPEALWFNSQWVTDYRKTVAHNAMEEGFLPGRIFRRIIGLIGLIRRINRLDRSDQSDQSDQSAKKDNTQMPPGRRCAQEKLALHLCRR